MKNKKNKRNTIFVFNLLMLSSFAAVPKVHVTISET